MKKLITICAACVAAIALSGCAILLGGPPVVCVFGNMLINTRVSTAYLYLITNAPEEIEVDLPFFYADNTNQYGNAKYSKEQGSSLITLSNNDIEMTFFSTPYEGIYQDLSIEPPQEASDSQKNSELLSIFYSGLANESSNIVFASQADRDAEVIYDPFKHISYKCFAAKSKFEMSGSLYDICGAVRLSKKGSVVLLDFRTNQISREKLKKKMLETIHSVQFRAEQQ